MMCKLEDLREKNVINLNNGVNLGCVDDIIMDTENAKITSLVIYGKKRFFGILGREEDIIVAWDDINMIGDDVVLVKIENLPFSYKKPRKKNFLQNLFS